MRGFTLSSIAMALLVITGLNVGLTAVFEYDLVGDLLSGRLHEVFNVAVGLSAIVIGAGMLSSDE